MNCPICNTAGLPDYNVSQVVCPQCNSDLNSFSLIEESHSMYRSAELQRKLAYVVLLGLTVIGGAYIMYEAASREKLEQAELVLKSTLESKQENVELLSDRIERLEQELIQPGQIKEGTITYVVRKGDNLAQISSIFYDDWRLYERIEKDNNLSPGGLIYPNDTLTIKLSFK